MHKKNNVLTLAVSVSLMFITLLNNSITVQASNNSPVKTIGSSNVSTQYTGLSLSILGDSISTFNDYIYSDYNIFYPNSGAIPMVEGTWWHQVLTFTGMELGSNASSSNTNVTGNSLAADGSAPGCSFRRIMDLKKADGSSPDIIIIYMGVNDFARDIPVGNFQTPSVQSEGVPSTFSNAYELMLQKIKILYPNASIYCCTLFARDPGLREPKTNIPVNRNGNTITDFNKQIRSIATAYGAHIIDVYNCGITYDNLSVFTSDGVHPNLPGAQLLANCITSALLNS
nr:SGNH/GDSL hydrolase family protein [uncultured Eisenbergiella sp.]